MIGDIKNTSFIGKFVCLLIIFTNLSQMHVFVNSGTTQYMSMPIWGLLIVISLFKGYRPNLTRVAGIKVCFIIIITLWLLLSATNPAYMRSSLPGVIMISMFVLTVSSCLGGNLSNKDLEYIYASYILSSLVVGFDVYLNFIAGNSFLGRTYLYDSKNSLCQILLTAWTLILFTKFQSENKLMRCLYLIIFIFFTYEICVLKSRASIIGMPIIFGLALVNGKVSPATQRYSILFLISIAILLLNGDFYNTFIDNIIFGGRDVSDINDLSSGRSKEWDSFLDEFAESPLVGIGRCKRESVILTSILEFGLLGGIPILLMAIYPLVYSKRWYKNNKNNVHFLILVSLACTYCLNGIFEQLAPFGPGVKCYFLWFMLGIFSRTNKMKKNNYE